MRIVHTRSVLYYWMNENLFCEFGSHVYTKKSRWTMQLKRIQLKIIIDNLLSNYILSSISHSIRLEMHCPYLNKSMGKHHLHSNVDMEAPTILPCGSILKRQLMCCLWFAWYYGWVRFSLLHSIDLFSILLFSYELIFVEFFSSALKQNPWKTIEISFQNVVIITHRKGIVIFCFLYK